MKDRKETENDEKTALHMWQSVDTWADYISVWERKREPYSNPWEVKSFTSSADEIVGLPPPRKRKIWGKTPKRWGELCLFYLIFYSVLVAFTISMFYFFFYTIQAPLGRPLYTDIINSNKGMTVIRAMRPGNPSKNDRSALDYVEYKPGNQDVMKYLDGYSRASRSIVSCTAENPAPEGSVCSFDISSIGPCATQSVPCIIARPTRSIGWIPELYKDASELPNNFPSSLASKDLSGLLFACDGDSEEDRKNIESIKYYPPSQSIPTYYFPYNMQKEYQDPLIGVNINVKGKAKVAIFCKFWAKNIHPDDDFGSLKFLFFMGE